MPFLPTYRARPGYLFVLPWYPANAIGGVNQALIQLVRLMNQARQYKAYLLVCNGPLSPPPAPHLECPVFSLRMYEPVSKRHSIRSLLGFLWTLPRTLSLLRSLLKTRDVRVINVVFPGLESWTFVLLKKLGLFPGKLVVSLQGNDIKLFLEETGLARWLARMIFRFADRVVSCSNGIREDLLRLEPRCERNSVVIHNSIDMDAFESMRPDCFSLPEPLRNRPFLLNIGKYEHKKGQDVLIRAFEQISKRFPELLLVMIGARGPETEGIRRMAAHSPAAQKIVMIENVPHEAIPVFLKAALVFVLPSRREGFPFVLLEAAACRKSVAAAAAVGVPEIIFDGETGRLVPVDDVEALAAALSSLVSDDDLRKRLSENLYTLVSEKFTLRHCYESYMSL